MTPDLFDKPIELRILEQHRDLFTDGFAEYLPDNLHVFRAFEREAMRAVQAGFKHYSARTIMEVLRHHSAMAQSGGEWKINNNQTPYLSRLFALVHPKHAELFEFRTAKAAKRDHALEAA